MLKLDWNLLFEVINLLILFVLLKKFLFKPVDDILAKRQQEVDKIYSDAAATTKEADDLKAQYAAEMSGLEEQRAEKMTQAGKDATAVYERIVKEAQDEAQGIRDQARTDAENDRKKILRKAQDEVADMVLAATVKIVGSKVDTQNNSDLYDTFIAKTGELDDTGDN